MIMKPDRPLREFGQRSLPPPFFAASRVPKEGTQPKSSKKPVSLSDFLDRKLARTHSTSAPSVQEKQTAFSSIRTLNATVGNKKDGAGVDSTLDGAVFKKLNCTANEERLVVGSTGCTDEMLLQTSEDGHESRKRKKQTAVSPSEDERDSSSKYLVVLGDDPKPRQMGRKRKFSDLKTKPIFNHYANGKGWWSCDREGVDDEEVGCSETWEGMTSTALGCLEWH